MSIVDRFTREGRNRRWRLPPDEALALRPDSLGEIEPELLQPPPRTAPWVWAAWSAPPDPKSAERHRTLCEARREQARTLPAARAWIIRCERTRDSEGPDIRAWLAFEHRGALLQGYRHWGFDAYHAYAFFTDSMTWFDASIREGGAATVLFRPDEPERWVLYGDLQLYLQHGFAEMVQATRSAGAQERDDAMKRLLDRWTLAVRRSSYDVCPPLADALCEPLNVVREAPAERMRAYVEREDTQGLDQIAAAVERYVPGVFPASGG